MDEKRFRKLPDVGIVRLGDIPINVWISPRHSQAMHITASPYYIALEQNSPAAFMAYLDMMQGLPTASSEISWDQFLDLKNDIAENGLRDLEAPIVVTDLGQIDGHHRLAILCHLYGTEAEALVSNGVLTFPARQSR